MQTRLPLIAGGVMCLLLAAVMARPAPSAAKRVLLLHQAGEPGSFRGKFDIEFADAIRAGGSPALELYEEALDAQRFPGRAHSRLVRNYFEKKYSGRRIDVIVTQGIAPLAFARQNRRLFGDPPIVTIVSPLGLITPADGITGLQGGFFINGTIDLALALFPRTQTVVVVDGARQNDDELQAEVERQLKARPRIRLVYLRDLALDTLLKRLAAIPAHSIVLFIKQTKRSSTEDVDQLEGLRQVLAASPAPVFSQIEELVGRGIVGGYVWRFEADARRMAAMARRLANGATLRDVPPASASYATLVDWRQLQRWRVAEGNVPRGSVILFRAPGFFEMYRRYVVGGVVVFALQCALIAGLLVQRRRSGRAMALNHDLAGRLIASQEIERHRIARDVHDDLGQQLAVLNLEIDLIANELPSDEARTRLEQVSERAHEIASAVHQLSHDLHPAKLQMLGLVAAVQSLCREIGRATGIEIDFASTGEFASRVDEDLALCLYRIVQEALNNVAKHSQATHARVRLVRASDRVELYVADSGRGFDVQNSQCDGSLGLVSMRERVSYRKGQFVIHTAPGRGTRIGALIPLDGASSPPEPTDRADTTTVAQRRRLMIGFGALVGVSALLTAFG